MNPIFIEKEKKRVLERWGLPFREINCTEVLEACLPVMNALCGKSKTALEWMDGLYQSFAGMYFPDSRGQALEEGSEPAKRFYLDILGELLGREKEQLAFDRCRDFEYLSEEEAEKSEIREEYCQYIEQFRRLEVYPFLRIARECTPFDTLGHVAGVHFTAMHIARQLACTHVPIDLALISAAAMIHDIGKFGCRDKEAGRVPYLHYYYTARFSKRFHFETIGHIAANHSTWDLELENLSVENLILIYADFRVKSIRDEGGEEQIRFWTLDQSYQVILDKLDNVDDRKRGRYRKVFQKLKDFEKFLKALGVSPNLDEGFSGAKNEKSAPLLDMEEIVERMKYNAIRSNIVVMHNMIQRFRFVSLLEEAKSEKDWRNVRSYLNILDEYSTYMTCAQKDASIRFLYEMMMHRDGDIRRQAARITGELVADYEIRYQKEVPEGLPEPEAGASSVEKWEEVLRAVLIPDHKISEQHKRWLGYALKTVFSTVMARIADETKVPVLEVLLKYYAKQNWEDLVMFILMDCAGDFSPNLFDGRQAEVLVSFAKAALERDNSELITAALRFLKLWTEQGWRPGSRERKALETYLHPSKPLPSCCRYLIGKIRGYLGDQEGRRELLPGEHLRVSSLFLENQQIDTPWIFKRVNLEILKECCMKDRKEMFQLAAHLVNMLQNTDRIVIKHHSGNELTELVWHLSDAEKYEIAMELVRGLEIGEYSISKYIPEYLGKIFFCLSEDARREVLALFQKMIDSTNPKAAVVTLETVGIMLRHFFDCSRKAPERKGFYDWCREVLEGLLFRGMAHYLEEVSQEAFYIIGHNVFGSPQLDLDQKYSYFQSAGRKLLTLMGEEKNHISLYHHAAALNHIYRFLSDYLFLRGKIPEEHVGRIAFFPGTFDPFSLGHKEIVKEIRKRGFRVYLALDEFSWSKKTQPHKIRKKIVKMSSADLREVYLFPEEIPVNISNPADLRRLKDCFPGKEVYLVVGSDVVEHASAYRHPAQADSVHHFPHIIFMRNHDAGQKDFRKRLEGKLAGISGEEGWGEKVHCLSLSKEFEEISSTKIREHIDRNRDISNLVDQNVQNYIYDMGLYTREPMFKFMSASVPVDAYHEERIQDGLRKELAMGLLKEFWDYGRNPAAACLEREEAVLIRDEQQYRQIIGIVLFHRLSFARLYEECGSIETAAYLRKHVFGKAAVISGIYGREAEGVADSRQSVLTEMLIRCAGQGYTYGICFGGAENEELLLAQGFVRLPLKETCYLADLRNPIVLFGDACMSLKEPFRSSRVMKEKIWERRKALQQAFARLYPGNLVLCLDSGILNHRLLQRITGENQVPMAQTPHRTLGEKMCVPFGRILRGALVPNCVTKELDAEKIYYPDMERFVIREYPNGADLDIQIRTIRSFQRPVILVDDLYHKGYRMERIDPALEREGVEVGKTIVGVLSGRGKDLADLRGKKIDSVYFLPNMRGWFMESALYPFIGGDSIMKENERELQTMILPSVNSILPYQVPHFLEGISAEGYYQLSGLCLENAEAILRLLEKEYQKLTGRKLTVRRLGEVMAQPRCPDLGMEALEVSCEAPSAYLKYEKNRLKRLKHISCLQHGTGQAAQIGNRSDWR